MLMPMAKLSTFNFQLSTVIPRRPAPPPEGVNADADGQTFNFELSTFDCYPPALCATPGGGLG